MCSRVLVLVVVLLAAVSGCRSGEEIAQLRQAVEAEMAKAPLPPGATLKPRTFDKGCHDFFECADGPDRPAVYEAAIELKDPPAGLCGYFVTLFRESGFQLVSSVPTVDPFVVDSAACAAGHPAVGTVTRPDGRSFTDRAELRLTQSGDVPMYKLTDDPGRPVAAREARLTRSEIAHVRGTLDREFVLAAEPASDGITTRGPAGQQWSVSPSATSLRFEVTCDERDEVELQAKDPAAPDPGRRTVSCTGAATEVELPVSLKGDKVFVAFRVYEIPPYRGAYPPRRGNYAIRFVPAG